MPHCLKAFYKATKPGLLKLISSTIWICREKSSCKGVRKGFDPPRNFLKLYCIVLYFVLHYHFDHLHCHLDFLIYFFKQRTRGQKRKRVPVCEEREDKIEVCYFISLQKKSVVLHNIFLRNSVMLFYLYPGLLLCPTVIPVFWGFFFLPFLTCICQYGSSIEIKNS